MDNSNRETRLPFGKHIQLSRTQVTTLTAAAIGMFVIVFTIFAAHSLIGQVSYQGKVISAQSSALAQIEKNEKSATSLAKSYATFINNPINAIGGSSTGTGPQDGTNAKLILDALPPKYDFPALTSSLEKIITGQNMQVLGISGQDQQVKQQDNTSSANPEPVPMPFSISALGTIGQVQALITEFEHSIRPFQIQSLELKGDQDNMTVNITAQTYFQPAKNFNVTNRTVE